MSLLTATTRTLAVPALLTALALGLPAPANAQNTVTPAQASAPAQPAAATSTQRAPRGGVEQRIADLHKRLKITAAEEDQWKQVADVMRQNAADVEAAVKDRSQNTKTMSAMENLQSYEKIAQAHEQGLQRLIPVFQTLYAGMSDDQKKNADAVFRAAAQRQATRAKSTKKG